MIWMRLVGWILRVLREGPTPRQLSGGLALGMAMGLIDGWPIQNLLLLLLLLILSVNIGSALLGAVLGSMLGLLLDPVADALGGWLLQDIGALQGVWTAMYNSPPWALTRFNNTVALGSTVLALVLIPIVFVAGAWAVRNYRERVLTRLKGARWVQAIMGSRFYGWFLKVQDMGFI
jgi:uncharacterized protein (TIGR03546 family)